MRLGADTAVASASISCCKITCSAVRMTSDESEALSASSTSSKADWDRAIVWFSFESSLAGSSEASHGGSSTFRSQTGSYTTSRDVTCVRRRCSGLLETTHADTQGYGAPVSSQHRVHAGPGLRARSRLREDACMALVRDPEALLELVRTEVVGKVISAFEVYGVNNLKTVAPPLTDLTGKRVSDTHINSSAHLILEIQKYRLEVNLERTGGLVVSETSEPWRLGGGGPQPTARMVLEGGRAIDFREPGKTKRITFRLTHPEVGLGTRTGS